MKEIRSLCVFIGFKWNQKRKTIFFKMYEQDYHGIILPKSSKFFHIWLMNGTESMTNNLIRLPYYSNDSFSARDYWTQEEITQNTLSHNDPLK